MGNDPSREEVTMSTAQIRTRVSFRKTAGLYPESATATVMSGEHKGERFRFAPEDALTCEDCTWLSWRAALALAKEIGQGDVEIAGVDNEGRTYYNVIQSDL
jgi:hypothetical protein